MLPSPCWEGPRAYEINYRMVRGLLEIGPGKSSLGKLCSVLSMPKAMSDDAFSDSVTKIKSALELEAPLSMKKAAKEEPDAVGIQKDQVAQWEAMFDGTSILLPARSSNSNSFLLMHIKSAQEKGQSFGHTPLY